MSKTKKYSRALRLSILMKDQQPTCFISLVAERAPIRKKK